MIDLKNYESLIPIKELDNICKNICCNTTCETCPIGKMEIRLSELENLIEQGKLVEKIEPKTAMTNREYLNTLSNRDFARAIATKVATTQEPNFNEGLKYTEIINDIQIDFEEWLNEEHKECENE